MMSDESQRNESPSRLEFVLAIALPLIVVQSAWLAARQEPTLPYFANVAIHFFGGLVLAILVARWWLSSRRSPRPGEGLARVFAGLGAGLFVLSALAAVVLAVIQNTKPHRWVLNAHIIVAVLAAWLLGRHVAFRARELGSRPLRLVLGGFFVTGIACAVALAPRFFPKPEIPIANPPLAPAAMEDESMGGAEGPFFPSSIKTSTGGRIPSNFFLTSESCGQAGCHPDITTQWRSSMHHFASFNNQFYRKSIEYMQSVAGVQSSKWCAGCHDVALLLDGKFDKPIAESLKLPEAQAGLACTACHAITSVHGTMGQGGYTIEYPPLHDLATSQNVILKGAHDFLLRLDPAPHAQTFLKPFHGKQHGEFCSACHKVHLDKPVNSYRWIRGFNDYDNWQASGVSGQGARSFYYPDKPSDCVDCHMSLVKSDDKGNRAGFVHDHRFAAANTAVPTVNGDEKQLALVEAFLKDKVTVDVFALARGGSLPPVGEGLAAVPEGATHFAVGEEMEAQGGALAGEAPVEIVAPLGREGASGLAAVRRGESVRVDVVVRTRGVGHFFPGGTVDAFDVWVELKAEDETGRPIFWSGRVEDGPGGKGPVDKGAHVYRSLMIDEHGNAINKRNAWAARAVVYVRLIPPGAADTVRYRLQIPADCGNEVRVSAKLNYRKFSHYYTQFAYAGVPAPGSEGASVTPDHDDREFVPTGDTSDVSGKLKEIPDLPIVVISSAKATLAVVGADDPLPVPAPGIKADRGRWNDYGIGLLLAGDLRAALEAFEIVCVLEPEYPDGWVNIARVRVLEGDAAAALAALDRAFALKPDLARAHFFAGQALKLEGRLDEAIGHYEKAAAQYPRDRVVLGELARACFLKRDFARSREWGNKVLEVDPEDVRAHYQLMLACRGLGDDAGARDHEARYLRFKGDEDSQVITGEYRRTHPEDNNERQRIHEHVSVPPGDLAPAESAAGQ